MCACPIRIGQRTKTRKNKREILRFLFYHIFICLLIFVQLFLLFCSSTHDRRCVLMNFFFASFSFAIKKIEWHHLPDSINTNKPNESKLNFYMESTNCRRNRTMRASNRLRLIVDDVVTLICSTVYAVDDIFQRRRHRRQQNAYEKETDEFGLCQSHLQLSLRSMVERRAYFLLLFRVDRNNFSYFCCCCSCVLFLFVASLKIYTRIGVDVVVVI